MKELITPSHRKSSIEFPGYARGIVLAYDVTNGPSPDALVALLREAEASVRSKVSIESVAEHERIRPWRDAFKAFGAKPSEYRSSIEAMTRRALRNDELPSINALVDIGNIISLRHLLPVGGHSLDGLTRDMELRFATGSEDFIPLGATENEHPLPGEVIFAEGNTVLTRRWTWRQGSTTLTLPETRNIEFNIDGLPPVGLDEMDAIAVELMGLVGQYCGGRFRCEMLTRAHPSAALWDTRDAN